jgi:hypothetical protein
MISRRSRRTRREVIAFFQRGCITKDWFERKPATPKRIRRLFAV